MEQQKIRRKGNNHLEKTLMNKYRHGWDEPRNLFDSRAFIESEEGMEIVKEKLRKIDLKRRGNFELGDFLQWHLGKDGKIVGEMV